MRRKRGTGAKRWIDPDDAPELTAEFFRRADIYEGNRLVRRGRPPLPDRKRAVSLRLDPDVLGHFRRGGPGWQSHINAALRRAAKLPAEKRKAEDLSLSADRREELHRFWESLQYLKTR
jgi:uncharacterized protein (DUF4415 family)